MQYPGAWQREVVRMLLAHFLIGHTYFELLSENFQSNVRSFGDEKLFHYKGNTACIIQVPSKRAKIGFWATAYLLRFI